MINQKNDYSMKLNKLFLGLLGIAAFTMTACSDDDDYTMTTVSGQQVYFSSNLGEVLEINPDASVTNLPLQRVNKSGSYTAQLKVTLPENSIYSVPSQVSFADGETSANLPISYDPSKLVRGVYDTLTVEIIDKENAGRYGKDGQTVYTCLLGAAAWDEWQPYNADGTCTYTYVNYFSGDDVDLPFYVRKNTADPNHWQFKIGDPEKAGGWANSTSNPYGGTSLILDYDASTGIVSCASQYVLNNSNYGAVNVTDYFNYWTSIRGYSDEEIAADGIFGSFDPENGYIYIPICWYVSAGTFGYDFEIVTIGGYDRRDLSVEVVYNGKFIDAKDNYSIISNVTLGADVSKAYVALVPGEGVSEDVLKTIIDKTYSPLEEITESQEVTFAANDLEDGTYSIVVVPFLEKDAQAPVYTSFKYATGSKETWDAIATGVYKYTVSDFSQSQAGGIYEGDIEAVLYQSSADKSRYKIAPWAGETSNGLLFTMNADGTLVVDGVETGDSYGDYGMIYATDFKTAGVADMASSYDAETGVFSFYLAWQVEAGSLAFTLDTFTLTGNATARAEKADKKATMRHGFSLVKTLKAKRNLQLVSRK